MSARSRLILTVAGLAPLVLLLVGRSVLYTINERELAVILQFGEPVASRTEPGLYLKAPFIQEVARLPKTLQVWHGTQPSDKLVDVPTSDGKKIEATVWAAWRITDPVLFVQTLRTIDNAESRVKEFVRSTARDIITANTLAEVVRSTDRTMSYSLGLPESVVAQAGAAPEEVPGFVVPPEAKERVREGRAKIMAQIKADAQSALASDGQSSSKGRGIELVDVGIARVEFVPQVREAAFNRAIALMEAIAVKATSEGEQRKKEIINKAEAEAELIRGQGSQEANRIRGQAEAQIIQDFAAAIRDSGDFYNFLRTLELYQKSLGKETRLVLTTDSALFHLLKEAPEVPPAGLAEGSAPSPGSPAP